MVAGVVAAGAGATDVVACTLLLRPCDRGVMARRVVAAVLILVSLALLTVYLRESDEGGLHAAQRLGLAVLSPFEVAGRADRATVPGRVRVRLRPRRREGERPTTSRPDRALREELVSARTAAEENESLREALAFVDGPRFPDDFTPVSARVIAQPAEPRTTSEFWSRRARTTASIEGSGCHRRRPRREGDEGDAGEAQVTLLTDQASPSPRSSARTCRDAGAGIVEPLSRGGAGLVLDRVDKARVVEAGDTVVTSGWRLRRSRVPLPVGIPIGVVTSVGQQDIDLYKRDPGRAVRRLRFPVRGGDPDRQAMIARRRQSGRALARSPPSSRSRS